MQDICKKYTSHSSQCRFTAENMHKYALNMHQICIKYASNVPLHRLHAKCAENMAYFAYMCKICHM